MTNRNEVAPAVAAIIIFYDARPFLAEAIESVLRQTFSSWELLLVDDGSKDGSRRVAEDYSRRLPGKIRVVEHERRENRGMSASRNLGLRCATAPYVGFLDADDRWPPDKLTRQVVELERDPSLSVVVGSIRFFGALAAGEHVVAPALQLGTPIRRDPLLRAMLLDRPAQLTTLGNPLIRRTALLEVGGLEDGFVGQSEDAVALCKLALRYSFRAIDEVSLEYRRHANASSMRSAQAGTLAAGDARFARWLRELVCRSSDETRAWALPIASEYLFRCLVLEAWFRQPNDPLHRRVRLIHTTRELAGVAPAVLTFRRSLRLVAQLLVGLRSRALTRLQEPALRSEGGT